MSDVRSLIREAVRLVLRAELEETVALNEAAKGPGEAAREGYAMSLIDLGRSQLYVLWNPQELEAAVNGYASSHRDLARLGKFAPTKFAGAGFIVGMLEAWKPEAGRAWDAATVMRSAAASGWGPMLYDAAMADFGRLAPDRGAVSGAAARVWSTYYSSRRDVKHHRFDDAEAPVTPPKVDDEILHEPKDDPGNSLNYAYELEPGAARSVTAATTKLTLVGERSLDELSTSFGASLGGDASQIRKGLDGLIYNVARYYFMGQFDEDS